MFSSLGHFRNVSCPRRSDCSLPTCPFSHSAQSPPYATAANGQAQEYDPFSAGEISSPPLKKRRLDSSSEDTKDADSGVSAAIRRLPAPSVSSATAQPAAGPRARHTSSLDHRKPASMARTVSPPAAKTSKKVPEEAGKKTLKVESLTPRNVAQAPAVFKMRLTVLQKLHEQMKTQNSKLAGSDPRWKSLVMSEQELITFALDEEEAATKLEPSIYRNAIAQIITQIKKMTTDEWIKKITTWRKALEKAETQSRSVHAGDELRSVGLATLSQQTSVLRHLQTSLEGLEQYGYVTSPPSDRDITAAKAGLQSAKGFETCDRCGTRFQVFPGRDDMGRLTTGSSCRYHWARANRQGRSEPSYPCCNKPEGSEGCSVAETHVYAVKNTSRLASILQFERTPDKPDVRPLQPVSFDCEMGYTTLGMEVIRVTAVSWPNGQLLFDVLVRTYGEILDLNTRFSGVTPDAYGAALPVSADIDRHDVDLATDLTGENKLLKVESPAAARQLLFNNISPATPLIGHAIENDLNVVRIIHPVVIDTVLLYPHPRGLPVRWSLKILSQKYLLRGIQAAGAAGHDSKEDAVATGDLVIKKVVEKWKMMKHEGWQFVDGILTAPDEASSAVGAHAML